MFTIALKTFYVISPILLIVFMGYLAGRIGWIKESGIKSLTKIVFYIGLPALLIDEISRINMSELLNLRGPIVLVITSSVMGTIGYITAVLKKLPPSHRGVWALSSFRANMAFIGLPVALNALGQEGLKYCALVLMVGVTIFNILTIFFLLLANKNTVGRFSWWTIIKEILTNPLIIGSVIGFLFSFIRPNELPIVDLTLSTLKKIPLPLALIAIGARLKIKKSIINLPKLFIPVMYKLLLTPILGGILLYLFGAKPLDFVSTILLLSSPVAIISYVMVLEMGGDSESSANIILTTTFLSFFSLSIILFILGLLGIWKPLI